MINEVTHKVLSLNMFKRVLVITKKCSLNHMGINLVVFRIDLPLQSVLIFKWKILKYKNLDYSKPHFFQEDLSEHVVQGDALPGHVGTACLLSSTIAESGKSAGILTLPIMSRNSRKTIGRVRGKPGEAGWSFTISRVKIFIRFKLSF